MPTRYLFAFTYKHQQYMYTWLAPRYVDSPSIFNKMLAKDLQHLNVASIVSQYVDYILICSLSIDQCEKDSTALLTT